MAGAEDLLVAGAGPPVTLCWSGSLPMTGASEAGEGLGYLVACCRQEAVRVSHIVHKGRYPCALQNGIDKGLGRA